MEKQYVDLELLEYDDDILCYNEVPFTGICYTKYPDGALENETSYKNGFPHGIFKKWYPTGQLRCKGQCKNGRGHGRRTYWHPNGSVKSIAHYEFGLELDYKEWDESGQLIERRELDSNDSLLLKLRRIYGENE